MGAHRFVIGFADDGCDRRELVGGKAASLGRLVAAGLPVPAGFTVATSAYASFMARLEPEAMALLTDIDRADPAGIEPRAAAIQALILAEPVPDAVVEPVAAAYTALAGGPGEPAPRVAVRSSGTAEDLAEASFAGMHDTYLDILGVDGVLDALRRCWASLWTARAIAYRHDAGTPRGALLAVAVQRMVAADVSGILFTADPLSGDPGRLIVNASWGLGEAVASGIVTPDAFVVERETLACTSRTLGAKEVTLVRDPDGSGVVELDTPAARRTAWTLTDDQLAALARMGLAVELLDGGRPQDIEFAIEAGRLQLLQARPVTGF